MLASEWKEGIKESSGRKGQSSCLTATPHVADKLESYIFDRFPTSSGVAQACRLTL